MPASSFASESSAAPADNARLEALTQRAHALRERGVPEALKAAVEAYDMALAAFLEARLPVTSASVNQHASLWMKRGISLLGLGAPADLREAIACFDRAIHLRQGLNLRESPWYRWMLAAGWMNRADALTRLGAETQVREAIGNYDLAIAHLQTLPLPAEPLFRWRLGVAWLNRGLSCQALNQKDDLGQALRCFDNCIALFRPVPNLERLDDRRTLAAAWFNRANLLLGAIPPPLLEARAAARAAIEIARQEAESDAPLAEVAIKARHVLCQGLAELLEAPEVDRTEADAWILEATDAVEESLRISRQWEARGHRQFRPFLEQMFHFGARIYRAFQPHFLAEFLADGQAAVFTEPMRQAAGEALAQAAQQIRGEGLSRFTPETMRRLLGTLAALNEAAANLRQHQVSA